MRVMTAGVAIVCLLLIGCTRLSPTVIDQCMRREIFKECMAALPKGPDHTEYNDWDEVVGACGRIASFQAIRLRTHVKPECRSR